MPDLLSRLASAVLLPRDEPQRLIRSAPQRYKSTKYRSEPSASFGQSLSRLKK
jgi:hypothetical protein